MINFAHAHIISRPRLLAKIQQAPEHRITFISAPVGFGKSVLAEQFTGVSPFPVAWHRVEERERDVPKLFAHSLAALSAISPEIRSLPRSIDASPSDLAAQIGAYLQDTLDFRFFYIMDDIHHIGGSVAAGKWLESLISHVPENCHLILISRTHLSLPVNLLLRDKVLVINESDLRLTDDELTQLAKQIAKGGFHAARLGEIRQQFDGWIAGSIVALRPLPPEIRRADISGGQNDALALFAVLAKNILASQPPAIHRFLLVSSVLQKITPELCQDALHLVNANSYLSQIAARNLFLSRTDDGVAYHVLFRDFLQGQLRELDASGFKAFHNQAADYFAQIDQLDDAFYHYLRASNAEGAVRIADRAADALYAEGHIETLLDWADKLNTTNERSPKLLTVCAMIRLDRYEYRDAEALLLEAQLLFQQANDAFGTGRIEFQRAMLDQQRGQLQAAVTSAEKLLALTQSARLRGNALNVLGLAHLDSGNLPSAIQSFKAALPFYTTHLDANAKAKLYQNLGVAFE